MSPKSKSLLVTFARIGLDSNPDAPGAVEVRRLLDWVEAGQTGEWDHLRKPKAEKQVA